MTSLTRAASLVAIVLLLVHPSPRAAYACSCVSLMNDEPGVRSVLQDPVWDKGTDVLFVGTSTHKRDLGGDAADYDVRVERVFRGDLPERIVLQNRRGSAMCGFAMSVGLSEVVSARRISGDRYESGLCGVFRATADDGTPSPIVDLLERLAPGRPPRSADEGIDWIAASIAVAALSAGLAAIVLFVRRRGGAAPT